MARLYVGNLSYEIDDRELADLFAPYGVTSATVPTNGRSRGFGFVELPDDRADQAIREMNGRVVQGRSLTVNMARPREERRPVRPYAPRPAGRPRW